MRMRIVIFFHTVYPKMDELAKGTCGRDDETRRGLDDATQKKETLPPYRGVSMSVADQWRDILFAEDNPSDAALLRISFREHGHLSCRLHVVHDGKEVLAYLQQEGVYAGMPRPHLLILDIGMPGANGWQVLETIRATPALAMLPVVMLTGILSSRDEEQRATLQPLACFVKPMKLEAYAQLVGQLEQFLD